MFICAIDASKAFDKVNRKYLMYKLNLKQSSLISFFLNGKKLENTEKLKDIKLMSECLSKNQEKSSDIKLDYTINYLD